MNRMMKIIAGGFVLSAAITAHAGANLIKNGTFEGTATQANWGAYATPRTFQRGSSAATVGRSTTPATAA